MEQYNGKTLLLVEDDALVAMDESRQLQECGYRVIPVQSGTDAVTTFQQEPDIDLVLMDINLGDGKDGTRVARELLAIREVPILFLSSHTEPEIVEKTEAVSSYGYVVKNSGITVLDASIKMAFRLFAANRRLEEETQHLVTTLNSIGDAVIATDMDARIVRINPIAAQLTGWTVQEAVGRPLTEVFRIVNGKSREPVDNPVTDVLKRGTIVGLANHTLLLSKDGTEYQIADSAAPIRSRSGATLGVVLVFRDVSAEYKLRETLAENEARFRALFEQAGDGVAVHDLKGYFIDVNQRLCDLFGYTRDEFRSMHVSQTHPPDQEVLEKTQSPLTDLEKTRHVTFEAPFRTKSGEIFEGQISAGLIEVGDKQFVQTIFRDISQRKRAQAELAQREAFLADVFDSVQDGISVLDTDLRILRVNKTMQNWYQDKAPLAGKQCFVCYQDRKTACSPCPSIRCMETGHTEREIVPGPPGSVVEWIELFSFPVRDRKEGRIMGAVEFVRDITEQKRAQKDLHILSATVQQSTEGIAIADLDGQITYANDAWAVMHGYEDGHGLVGVNLAVFHSKGQLEKDVVPFNKKVKELGTWRGEVGHITCEGQEFPTLMTSTLLRDEQGRPLAIAGIAKDITERKQAEADLRQSDRRYRELFENSRDGFVIVDSEGRFISANQAYCHMLGYSLDELKQKKDFYEITPEKWREWEREEIWEKRLLQDGYSGIYEKEYMRKDGTVFPVELQSYTVHREDGSIEYLWGIARDISDRKQTEDRIRSLLKEKDIMLKEVHHRIKNNMNTVKSMLSLQAVSLKHEAARKELEEAASRITSMMLLYDKLYRGENPDLVSIRGYLSSLVDEVVKTNLKDVHVTKEIDDLMVPEKTASSLGIIVNELVTNSLKHAFGKTQDNRISITAKQTKNRLAIVIQDNGCGFKHQPDSDGFGLSLVESLVKKLGGKLKIEAIQGTRCSFDFPV